MAGLNRLQDLSTALPQDDAMRRASKIGLLVVIAPVVVMACAMVVFFVTRTQALLAHIEETVNKEASALLGANVSVGKVSLLPGGVMRLQDIAVAQPEPNRPPVIAAREIRIGLRPLDFALGRAAFSESIDWVEILSPTLNLVRGRDGKWDILEILKPSLKPRRLRFKGIIVVRGGQVLVNDLAHGPSGAQKNIFHHIDAQLDFRRSNLATFRITSRGPRRRMSRLIVQGRYDLTNGGFRLGLDAADVALAYWSRYPLSLQFMRLTEGKASIQAQVIRLNRRRAVGYQSIFAVSNATTEFPVLRRPITDVNGKVFLENERVRLDLRGRLGSTPFSAFGDVIGFHKPRLSLELKSDPADLGELAALSAHVSKFRMLTFPGRAQCHVIARGPSRTPRIDFDVSAPSLRYKWFHMQNVHAIGQYFQRQAILHNLMGQALNGRITASGKITEFGFDLQGHVSKLDLRQIPPLAQRDLSGATSGQFNAHVAPDGIRVRYTGTINNGAAGGFPFKDARVVATFDGESFRFAEISCVTMGGIVAAAGRISTKGTLDLEVSGADLDSALIQERYQLEQTEGKVYFAGKLTGTIDDPVYDGTLEAQPIRFGEVSAGRAEAKLTASRSLIDLRQLVIHKGPGDIIVSGTVLSPKERSPGLNLSVNVKGIEIGALLKELGSQADVEGLLWADLIVSGSVLRPSVTGTLHAARGRAVGYEVSSLDAQISYKRNTLTVSEIVLRSGQASVLGEAEVGREGNLRAEFAAVRVPIGDFTRLFADYPSMSGEAQIRGVIEGTTKSPEVLVKFDSKSFRVNNEPFGSLSGTLFVRDGRYVASGVTVSDNNSVYTASKLDYAKGDRTIAIEVDVTNGNVGKLVRMFERSEALNAKKRFARFVGSIPRPIDGSVEGKISGTIFLAQEGAIPDLSYDVTFKNLRSGTGDFDKVESRGYWKGRALQVDQLLAVSGDTSIMASGGVGASRELALNFDAHHIEIASIARWLGIRSNLSGVGDVTIVANGTTHNPIGQGSIEIMNPKIGGAEFEGLRARLSTGQVSSAETSVQPLNIDELTLVIGAKELTASGFMPVEWRTLTIPEQGALSLQASFDSAVLDLLPVLTAAIEKGSTGGNMAGAISISIPAGSWKLKPPLLRGNIAWQDGSFRLSGLKNGFRDLNLQCTLEGDRIRIVKFTGTSSEGGQFAVSGKIAFTDTTPSLSLTAKSSNLGISWNDLTKTFHETVSCVLDSDLSVEGELKKPILRGTVAVRKGLVDLTTKATEATAKRTMRVDPQFGSPESPLKVILSRNTELRAGMVRSPLSGEISVYGSLSRPFADGRLDISGGTIHFPVRTLRIQPGSEVRIQYRPQVTSPAGQESPHTPAIIVDMKAKGRLVAVRGFGRRKQYTIAMEASGPLESLQPRFTSSPPDLSEHEIVAALTGRYQIEQVLMAGTRQEISRGLSNIFSTAVTPAFLEPIGQALGAALGFEEFALEAGYQEPLQLSITDQLAGPLYVSYTSSLGARPDYADSRYELRLGYRLPRGIELSLSTNEQKELGIQVEGKLRF